MREKVKGGSGVTITAPNPHLLQTQKFLPTSGSNTFKAQRKPQRYNWHHQPVMLKSEFVETSRQWGQTQRLSWGHDEEDVRRDSCTEPSPHLALPSAALKAQLR